MADSKISALTSLTAAGVDTTADVLAIVDTSTTTTKKILVNALAQAMIVLGTEQASTSGTSIDFTSIPSGTKRIKILFNAVSTNGSSNILVQLGDSGGVETTGYVSETTRAASIASSTAGFLITDSIAASNAMSGAITLDLENSSNFTWIGTALVRTNTGNGINVTAGVKATSAELDRVRITTVNGTDTFDAGAINITYS